MLRKTFKRKFQLYFAVYNDASKTIGGLPPTDKRHISRENVEHIAWLAHIELTEEEKTLFTDQFNRILDYFKKINEADTEDVPPTYHVLDLVNVYREDEPKEPLPSEEILKNAPKKEDNFFKSPRII